jgi:hypothetical protein
MGGRQKGKEHSPWSTIFTTELSQLPELTAGQKLIMLITDRMKGTENCQATNDGWCRDKY